MYLKTWLLLMSSLLPLYDATLLPLLAVRARGVCPPPPPLGG
jgi:hypothetical protein